MAIIGFIFIFLVLCYATVVLVLLTWGTLLLSGKLKLSEVIVVLLGGYLLGVAWHWLLHNVTISIGGI